MIELLTVIAIIALVAAILLPALGRARQQAWETTARTIIASLEGALANYVTDYGDYPRDDKAAGAGSGTVMSCVNLITRLEDSDGKNNGKVYATFRDEDKDSNGNLLDPWGESYCYRYTSGTVQGVGMKFNIWSRGADKQTDPTDPSASVNQDDITNWKNTRGQ